MWVNPHFPVICIDAVQCPNQVTHLHPPTSFVSRFRYQTQKAFSFQGLCPMTRFLSLDPTGASTRWPLLTLVPHICQETPHYNAGIRRSIKLANFLGVVSFPKTIGRWNRWTMTRVTCHVTIVTSKNCQTIRTQTLLCCFIFWLRNNIKTDHMGLPLVTRRVSNLLVVHFIGRLSLETKPRPSSWPTLSIVWRQLNIPGLATVCKVEGTFEDCCNWYFQAGSVSFCPVVSTAV